MLEELVSYELEVELPKVELESLNCLNCGKPIPSGTTIPLFCMEFCRLVAESVRYHRRVLADGRYHRDQLVKDAIQVRLQKIQQGVVVRRNTIPLESRSRVFARTDGVCSNKGCTNPATDIDHIEGRGVGDVESNLQSLCHGCHIEKSKTDARTLSDEMIAEQKKIFDRGLLKDFRKHYANRALSATPRLVSDDSVE